MSSVQSGGATPEIRQNYGGGHIVFNAIHAWSLVPSWSQNQKKRSRNIVLLPFFWRTDFDILQEIGEVVQHMIWSSQETWNSVRCKWIEGVNSRDFGCCCVTATSVLWRLTGWDWMMIIPVFTCVLIARWGSVPSIHHFSWFTNGVHPRGKCFLSRFFL